MPVAAAEEQKNKHDRFDFHYHEKVTKSNPYILAEGERIEHEEYLLKDRDFDEKAMRELPKSPRLEREIEKSKKRIIKLGEELGLDLESRLTENEDIHLLATREYKKRFENYTGAGHVALNEVFARRDRGRVQSEAIRRIQHELLHMASKRRVFIEKDKIDVHSLGYASTKNRDFEFFNEGLTELTNQKLYLDEGICAPDTSYVEEVIFVSELVRDIAEKSDLSYEDIFKHLLVGMFEGKRQYLKVINDLYGEKALSLLSKMKNDKDDIVAIARQFGLKEAVRKIKNYEHKKKIDIDVGEVSYNITRPD